MNSTPFWALPSVYKAIPKLSSLCIGGGHLINLLAKRVQERGLGNFRFLNYQDQAVLKFSLCVPDVHWISLKPELEGLIVPSKVYGIVAAGRPVIAIGAKNGEIARMVEQYQCGIVVEPGSADALVDQSFSFPRIFHCEVKWDSALERCSKPILAVDRRWSVGSVYSNASGNPTDLFTP